MLGFPQRGVRRQLAGLLVHQEHVPVECRCRGHRAVRAQVKGQGTGQVRSDHRSGQSRAGLNRSAPKFEFSQGAGVENSYLKGV